MNTEKIIKRTVREIPDWPKKGVNFKDITPLLQNKKVFKTIINEMARPYVGKKIDKIVGIDARGFIFAAALAYKLGAGLAIVRKKGKLPYKTIGQKYLLEYRSDVIEMHEDAIKAGEKVIMVDDVLATGGTMKAAINLVKKLEGKIESVDFLIELGFLNGRKNLKDYKIRALAKY